jgi:hypothetical protein
MKRVVSSYELSVLSVASEYNYILQLTVNNKNKKPGTGSNLVIRVLICVTMTFPVLLFIRLLKSPNFVGVDRYDILQKLNSPEPESGFMECAGLDLA